MHTRATTRRMGDRTRLPPSTPYPEGWPPPGTPALPRIRPPRAWTGGSRSATTVVRAPLRPAPPRVLVDWETCMCRVEAVDGIPRGLPLDFVRELANKATPFWGCRCDGSGTMWAVSENQAVLWGGSRLAGGFVCHNLPESREGVTVEQACMWGVGSFVVATVEGVVAVWTNVEDSSSVQLVSIPLQPGERTTHVVDCEPVGLVIATSYGELHILQAEGSRLSIQVLSKSSGMLAGLSRWMLGWGSGKETKYPVVSLAVGPQQRMTDRRDLWVMTEEYVELWHCSHNRLVWEFSLREAVTRLLCDPEEDPQHESLRVWLVDLHPGREGELWVLVASIPWETEDLTSYTLLELGVGNQPPDVLDQIALEHQADAYPELARLIVSEDMVVILWPSAFSVVRVGEETCVESYDLYAHSSVAVGGGWSGDAVTLVTVPEGLLKIKSTRAGPSPQPLRPPASLVFEGTDKVEDPYQIVLQSFQCFTTDEDQARSILCCMHKADVDDAVRKLSRQVIDSQKFPDPRWAEDARGGESVQAPLLLQRQLEEKQRRHNFFLRFVERTGLLEHLAMDCIQTIAEHGEKLQGALGLRRFQNAQNRENGAFLQDAITLALDCLGIELMRQERGAQDLFYTENVSRVDSIVSALVQCQEDFFSCAPGDEGLPRRAAVTELVNKALEALICPAFTYRFSNPLTERIRTDESRSKFLQWTAQKPVRDLFYGQYKATRRIVNDVKNRPEVLRQLHQLADIILTAFMDAKRVSKETALQSDFERMRQWVSRPFVERGEEDAVPWGRMLAEKYEDFENLMIICENNQQGPDLEEYFARFGSKQAGELSAFEQFVYKWYLDHAKYVKLLSQPPERHAGLVQFLQSYPHLEWIHSIQTGHHGNAAEALRRTAEEIDAPVYESTDQVTRGSDRRNLLLSLAKLSAWVASSNQPQMETVARECDNDLFVLQQQEVLLSMNPPSALIEGLSTPFVPLRLVELFLDPHYSPATHPERSQMALAVYRRTVGPHDPEGMILHDLWCRIIRNEATTWKQIATEHAAGSLNDNEMRDVLRGTVFFQCITAYRDLLPSEHVEAVVDEVVASDPGAESIRRVLETCALQAEEEPVPME